MVAKAHGGPIELEGVTVAEVNDKLQLREIETWYDPMTMFRQIAPNGVVSKSAQGSDMPSEAMDVGQDAIILGEQNEEQQLEKQGLPEWNSEV